MSIDTTRIALYTALKEGIEEGTPLVFDTIPDDDPITEGDQLWLRCYLDPVDTFQHLIGTDSPLERTIGFLIIEIYDREEKGYADIFRMCDSIKPIFRRKHFNSGSLRTERMQIQDREPYKNWNSKAVMIHYTEDENI